jgi:hypothetical protein
MIKREQRAFRLQHRAQRPSHLEIEKFQTYSSSFIENYV